jgi:hypothetical protein
VGRLIQTRPGAALTRAAPPSEVNAPPRGRGADPDLTGSSVRPGSKRMTHQRAVMADAALRIPSSPRGREEPAAALAHNPVRGGALPAAWLKKRTRVGVGVQAAGPANHRFVRDDRKHGDTFRPCDDGRQAGIHGMSPAALGAVGGGPKMGRPTGKTAPPTGRATAPPTGRASGDPKGQNREN